MHGGGPRDYLSDEFLDRVRRAYRLAIRSHPRTRGMWSKFDRARSDIHDALLAEDCSPLRRVFLNPISTDLFYGVDNLCLSVGSPDLTHELIDSALASDRGRSAQYQVHRLLELLNNVGNKPIIEIGPGMGRTAYLAYRSGLTDYTTVDLPLGIVAQACFLGRAIGPEHLRFAGERNEVTADCIKLLSAGQLPERSYSVALNVDSLSEMPAAEAFNYARWLSTHTTLFLSINHAKNLFTVREAMKMAGNAHCLSRSECPALPGYTEEVFSTAPAVALPRWGQHAFKLLVATRYISHRIAARLSHGR